MNKLDDELFDEETEVSINELADVLSGEDEDGDPKSVVECSLYHVETTDDGTLEKINEVTSFTAAPGIFVRKISFTGPFVMVELDFQHEQNMWLRRIMEVLEQFHSYPDKEDLLFTMTISNIKCTVDYYLALSNPVAYMKGLSKDNKPVIVQLLFAADFVNAVSYDFDLEEVKAEVLREMEGDEKAEAENEAMNESVMKLINEGTPMDENFYLNQQIPKAPEDKLGIRSANHTDLSRVRRSEADTDRSNVRGAGEQEEP